MKAPINILGICGSLRKSSRNRGLLQYVSENVPDDVHFEQANLLEIPFFNEDITTPPAAVTQLFDQMERADAFLFACNEYNYSYAPALKNAIDWASRAKDNHLLRAKPAGIMGAGGGMGTSRAQYHFRQVCVFVDIRVLNKPEVFLRAFSDAFDKATGQLVGEAEQEKVRALLETLVLAVKAER